MGSLYKKQGKLQEAEQMYQRALTGCKRNLDGTHPLTLHIAGRLESLGKS
jgi:hypothetical protein